MTIRLDTFSNSIPKLSSHLLPNESAQVADNCDVQDGRLVPLPSPEFLRNIAQVGAIRSIYLIGSDWLAWTTLVDVVKAQIPDSDDRVMYTGDGYPKQTNATLASSGAESSYPTATRRLGVTPPSAALSAVEPQGTGDGSVGDSVSYYYTLVTAWGEESAPSPATAVVILQGNQYARVKGFVKPTLAASGNDITHFRLYRGVSGASGSVSYQLVEARPNSLSGTPTYDISVSNINDTNDYVYDANSATSPTAPAEELGESCPTELWDAPPDDLSGLIQYQNGILAGFSGKTVYLSEPGISYAFPADNQYTVEEDIVAIGVHKTNLIIATGSFPTILQGYNPSQMAQTRLPYKYKCLSKAGLVSTPRGVIYPCSEGLLLLDGSTRTILTDKLYSKDQWDALNPSTLVGFNYEDNYIGFFQGTNAGIILDPDNLSGVLSITLPAVVYGGYVDPSTGRLILLTYDTVYKASIWKSLTNLRAGTMLTYTWTSKVFRSYGDLSYGVARVLGDFTNGSTTMSIYGDNTLLRTKVVSDETFFRIPGDTRYRDWYFTLSGVAEVSQVIIAQTAKEILSG